MRAKNMLYNQRPEILNVKSSLERNYDINTRMDILIIGIGSQTVNLCFIFVSVLILVE